MDFGTTIRIPDSLELPASFNISESLNIPGSLDGVADQIGSALEEARVLADIETALRDLDQVNISSLENLANRLPGNLGAPDATGEVPTGSAAVTREEAAVAASLSAAPRIVEALGPTATTVEVRGRSFEVVERYADPVSGFSALRLRPADGGAEVFSVDGLEVGSEADGVAAAGLGRLQVRSAAFAEMVADAQAVALTEGRGVQFTGPSLGGAVAQVAAYETAEGLVASGRTFPTGTVQLVTVDPLGGRDAAEAINSGSLSPAALSLIEALNLRTEGDLISRIGSHIGATLTLPALDAAGNPVTLQAADAHVNVVSLLQTLNSDTLFAAGRIGAPAEISGFAQVANAVAPQLENTWLASGRQDAPGVNELQIPGTASFDPSGTRWMLDADDNGSIDIAVNLSAPVTDPAIIQATTDLSLFG